MSVSITFLSIEMPEDEMAKDEMPKMPKMI